MRPIKAIQSMLRSLGLEVHRSAQPPPGCHGRLVGNVSELLEDFKARGADFRNLLDVGGFVGDWSRIAKAVYPDVNCFLIEPQVALKPQLDQFCAAFPGSRWINAGAGSAPGELELTMWHDASWSTFLPTENVENQAGTKRVKVPIVTIDSLIESGQIPAPDLVKIDVQGFELEVLKGAGKLFGVTEAFIIEVSLFRFLPGTPLLHEVVGYLGERGYVVYDFPSFLRRPYDGAMGQCDLCFVRENGRFRTTNRWE